MHIRRIKYYKCRCKPTPIPVFRFYRGANTPSWIHEWVWGLGPGWRAEPVQPIGCNDSARRILASGSHQTNTCKHISKAGSARSSDSRAIGRNSATGATGEGGDYGNNGRATAEEAEGGVSGCIKLKHLGSTARSGGENARHSDGGGGRCKIIATGATRGDRSAGIMGWK
jgi:hypothetical protein